MKSTLFASRFLAAALCLPLSFACAAALAATPATHQGGKSYLVTIKGPRTTGQMVCQQRSLCPFQVSNEVKYLAGQEVIIPKCPKVNGHLPLHGNCKPTLKLKPKKINIGVHIDVLISNPGLTALVQITRTRLLKMRTLKIGGKTYQLPETRTCHVGLGADVGRPVNGCHFTVLVKPMKANAKG